MTHKKNVANPEPERAGESLSHRGPSATSRDGIGVHGEHSGPVNGALIDALPASSPSSAGSGGSDGMAGNPGVTPNRRAVEAVSRPHFRTLDRDESEAIVARNHVGRIAYARGNSIGIFPVYYAYSEGWVYGRMRRSRKKAMAGWHGWWPVAFQVDEVEDLFHWRTVLVHGGFYALPADGDPSELDARRQAIDLLRRVIPQTFRVDDPMPSHSGIFRIAVQEITGSAASPDRDAELPSRDDSPTPPPSLS